MGCARKLLATPPTTYQVHPECYPEPGGSIAVHPARHVDLNQRNRNHQIYGVILCGDVPRYRMHAPMSMGNPRRFPGVPPDATASPQTTPPPEYPGVIISSLEIVCCMCPSCSAVWCVVILRMMVSHRCSGELQPMA